MNGQVESACFHSAESNLQELWSPCFTILLVFAGVDGPGFKMVPVNDTKKVLPS